MGVHRLMDHFDREPIERPGLLKREQQLSEQEKLLKAARDMQRFDDDAW